MAHILRKYTSNRGSALFMVISTMTALIISCMAMYFTMVSANSAQYAVFGQMQATQTAESVLDIVKNSLNPYNSLNADFQAKLLELEPGESITTDANGFMALDPNIETGKTPSEIGAYSVTITCLSKTGTVGNDLEMEFDYLVMSSFNGSRDALHYTQKYSENYASDPTDGKDGSGGDAELFAATGYIPNDAYIDGGYYLTSVFYDTQYTYMNTYGGSGENRIALDLRTGGDLMIGTDAMTVVHAASADAISSADVAKIGAVTWAIRGNFYPNFNSDFGMRGGSQVLVGGNFTFDSGNNSFTVKNDGYYLGSDKLEDHICVYVNGDLNYSGSDIKQNIWFFVNGKVTGVGNNQQSNARLFVTDRADTSELKTNMKVEKWLDSGTFEEEVDGKKRKIGLTYNEFIALLDQKTSTVDYYKWDLSKNTQQPDTQHINIRLNATNQPWTDDKGTTYEAYARNYVIAWPGSASESLLKSKGGNEYGVSGKTFIIDSVWTHGDNNTGQNIIIDTGDDDKNIMTIKLCDSTKTGEFSWFVDQDGSNGGALGTSLGNINNHKRLIVLRGRGTVLLDLPKGVTYQDAGYQVSANVGWLLIEGAKIKENDNGHLEFSGIDAQGKYSAKIVPYIHKTCFGIKEGETRDGLTHEQLLAQSCGCEFSRSSSTVKCSECNGNLTQVTCSIHGDVNKYCATCFGDMNNRTDWCVNHVDKKEFDTFYSTLTGTEKAWVTDSKGTVYPNTNFMLVSCDESADMRFSQTTKDKDIVNNEFFGFIYTPYVSYYAAGGAQAGGLIKLCGGMTVGDYDIRAIHAYIGCYPDHMPNDLAGMALGGVMPGEKLGGTTKTWKIDLGGFR